MKKIKRHVLKVKQATKGHDSKEVTVTYDLFDGWEAMLDMFTAEQVETLVVRQVLTEVRWKVGRMMKAGKNSDQIQAALNEWKPLTKRTAEDKDRAALRKLLNKYHDSEEAVEAFIDKLMNPEEDSEEGSHEAEGEEVPF